MVEMSQSTVCTDDFLEIELVDFGSMGHQEKIMKGVETYNKMVHALTNRCRSLADSLDVQEAKNAAQIATMNRIHEQKLKAVKAAVRERFVHRLRAMHTSEYSHLN